MIKKFLASGRSSIEVVEYDRETESFLYLGDVKTAKKTKYSEHFDTYSDAYFWLIHKVNDEILRAERDAEMWRKVQALIVEKHYDSVEEEYEWGRYAFNGMLEPNEG